MDYSDPQTGDLMFLCNTENGLWFFFSTQRKAEQKREKQRYVINKEQKSKRGKRVRGKWGKYCLQYITCC